MKKIKRLQACTRPLTGAERKAVEFVDLADNRVKINGHWLTAVFRNGKTYVNPKAVTI